MVSDLAQKGGRGVDVGQSRNVSPARGDLRFWGYFTGVVVAGLIVIISVSPQFERVTRLPLAFWIIIVLLVFLELRPLYTAGSSDSNGLALSQMFVFALLLQWGLGIAIFGQVIGLVIEHELNRKARWRLLFNICQYTLCLAAADASLLLLHQQASATEMARPLDAGSLPAIAAAALVWFLLNMVLVGLVVAFKEHTPWRAEVFSELGTQALYTAAMIALSPLVVLAANRSAFFVPLLLIPLIALHRNGAVSLEQQHKALHDVLTGLPNRKLILEQTTRAIQVGNRQGTATALLMLDLDRFKDVNDTLGHHVGDLLLQEVGVRLTRAMRPDDVVARLGGDEFAVLLPDVTDAAGAESVAQRISQSLAEPLVVQGNSLALGASIGIGLAPEHGTDCETLMQRADVAMYVAKESGTVYQTYSAGIDRNSTERLSLMGDLRRALNDGDGLKGLSLHYQPQIDLASGSIVGVEALLRWQHPVRGPIPPDEFVPMAERTVLMRPLSRWVFDTALTQLAQWQRQGLDLRMSINVCARDLHSTELVEFLRERIGTLGLDARRVQVELTESMLMSDAEQVRTTLTALSDLGLQMSLDDFGTGYSSLAHLRRLPVNEIKVDKSFVLRMLEDDDDRTVTRTIIELGAALGLRVVAEGVETDDVAAELGRLGCSEGQGWLWSRALPADELAAWVRSRSTTVPLTLLRRTLRHA